MKHKIGTMIHSIMIVGMCLGLIGGITGRVQAEHDNRAGGTISGKVTCLGFLSGSTREIFVNLWINPTGEPIPSSTLYVSCGDTYVYENVPGGTYYIGAFIDENESGDGPPDPGEPHTFYGAPDPIVISSTNKSYTDIDLELARYIERVSLVEGKNGLEEITRDSKGASISGDGRYVAFQTTDSSWITMAYIHDREMDTTLEFTANSFGNTGFYDPDISTDGDFIAVAHIHQISEENPVFRLFVKEWEADPENLAIVEPKDVPGSETADFPPNFSNPSISGDGCRVAFEFEIPSKSDQYANDIFMYDCDSGEVTLISVATNDIDPGDDYSFEPAISDDGLFVAFMSKATNLVTPNVTDDKYHIYVRDIEDGLTELIPVPEGHTGKSSYSPSLSADGRFVTFQNDDIIFIHDRETGETQQIPLIDDDPSSESYSPSISGDGRFVTFTGFLQDENEDWFNDIYVHDLHTGNTKRITRGFDGIVNSENTGGPAISADGRFVAFWSEDDALVVDDFNEVSDVFVYINVPTLTVDIIGDGSVSKEPDQTTYNYMDVVTLTPDPSTGFLFDSWTGADAADLTNNGDGTWSITMDDDKSVTANFVAETYTLEVIISPPTDGTVLLDPDQPSYDYGDIVTLTPDPLAGFSFDGWTGADAADLTDNGDGTWSITMDEDKSVTANFIRSIIDIFLPLILN